jgi:VWFA-related protein
LAQEGDPIFRSDTRLVVLHATVVDKKGDILTNLAQNAFRVYEDGVEQPLKIFRREDVPVSMGIVIDNSGSMRDKRRKVEQSALGLVKASNRDDEVFIVNFNDEAWLDVDFTNDIKKLEEGLTQIDSRGGTAMRDALDSSLDHLKGKGKKDKKVIIVVTDGNDNTSEMTLARLVQKAQNREVVVYAIGLLEEQDGREARRAKNALNAIANATGGQAFFPKNVEDLYQYALDIAHDIRNQYILAYSPLKQELDGTFRKINVTVNAKNRPTVRTRTGYYATAEAARQASSAPLSRPAQ